MQNRDTCICMYIYIPINFNKLTTKNISKSFVAQNPWVPNVCDSGKCHLNWLIWSVRAVRQCICRSTGPKAKKVSIDLLSSLWVFGTKPVWPRIIDKGFRNFTRFSTLLRDHLPKNNTLFVLRVLILDLLTHYAGNNLYF